jgi:hypothetical protein
LNFIDDNWTFASALTNQRWVSQEPSKSGTIKKVEDFCIRQGALDEGTFASRSRPKEEKTLFGK